MFGSCCPDNGNNYVWSKVIQIDTIAYSLVNFKLLEEARMFENEWLTNYYNNV